MAWTIDGKTRDYRLKITMDHTQVSETDTDVTITFRLDRILSSHNFWSHVKSDGGDIIVSKSDGSTRLPLEVADIDVGGNWGNIYFKGDKSTSNDIDYYIYYGNASASQPARDATYGKENAWPDHSSVYHMNADTSSQDDATSTDVDLILHENASYPQTYNTGRPFGRYLNKGVLSYWTIDDSVHNNVSNLSIEGWVRIQNWGGTWRRIFKKAETYELTRYSGEDRIRWGVSGSSCSNSSGDTTTGTWYYMVCVFKSADYVRYIQNNIQQATSSTSNTSTGSSNNNNHVLAESGSGQIDGDVAELRYADAYFTNNYYSDVYEQVENYSTFWSAVGSEEEDTSITGDISGNSNMSLTSISELSAIGVISGNSNISLTSVSDLLITGFISGNSNISLTSISDLLITGFISGNSNISLTNISELSIIGVISGNSNMSLTNISELSITGVISGNSNMNLTNISELSAIGVISSNSNMSLTSISELSIIGVISGNSDINLYSNAFLYNANFIPFKNEINPIYNHTQIGLSLLIEQFQLSNNLKNMLKCYTERVQYNESVLTNLMYKRNIDYSSGAQLDKIGDEVGIKRYGLNDGEYRSLIKFQIFINTSDGNPDTMILVLKEITNADIVSYKHQYPAKFRMFTDGTEIPDNLYNKMKNIKPVGVGFDIYALSGLLPFSVENDDNTPPDYGGFFSEIDINISDSGALVEVIT
jgi:hypothetical protein